MHSKARGKTMKKLRHNYSKNQETELFSEHSHGSPPQSWFSLVKLIDKVINHIVIGINFSDLRFLKLFLLIIFVPNYLEYVVFPFPSNVLCFFLN